MPVLKIKTKDLFEDLLKNLGPLHLHILLILLILTITYLKDFRIIFVVLGWYQKKLNTSFSRILHQNQKNFTSVASISLISDGMRFEKAMEIILMIRYFYKHNFFKFIIYTLKSNLTFILTW